jgi:hypothetical protein
VPTQSKYGVCRREVACQQEYSRRVNPVTSVYRPCENCGERTASALGFCRRTLECRRARARRDREVNKEAVLDAERRHRQSSAAVVQAAALRYRARADRPCRYAKSGCTEFAAVGANVCPEHNKVDCQRRYERKRDQLVRRLARAQRGLCPWCELPLADDTAACAIDHIIPKASGVVIDDEWNLQALHSFCNGAKKDKITPHALALAAEHGIPLLNAPAA